MPRDAYDFIYLATQIVSALAGISTVAIAGLAYTGWRRQIAGQSAHELAKKLSATLQKAEDARKAVLAALRNKSMGDARFPAIMVRDAAIANLPTYTGRLKDVAKEIEVLEVDARVVWNEVIAVILRQIRHACDGLANRADAEIDPVPSRQLLALFILPAFAPSFQGSAFTEGMDRLTAIAQQYLVSHVRADTSALSEKELSRLYKVESTEQASRALAEQAQAREREEASRDEPRSVIDEERQAEHNTGTSASADPPPQNAGIASEFDTVETQQRRERKEH